MISGAGLRNARRFSGGGCNLQGIRALLWGALLRAGSQPIKNPPENRMINPCRQSLDTAREGVISEYGRSFSEIS